MAQWRLYLVNGQYGKGVNYLSSPASGTFVAATAAVGAQISVWDQEAALWPSGWVTDQGADGTKAGWPGLIPAEYSSAQGNFVRLGDWNQFVPKP